MTRDEMLSRVSSKELTGWWVLARVQHEEREQEAERAKHLAESKDGEVIEYNKPPSEFDDDGDDE